jgi:hypothetical protein
MTVSPQGFEHALAEATRESLYAGEADTVDFAGAATEHRDASRR